MKPEEAIDELQYAIDLIKQNGQDWLDERDIPILEAAISALQEQEETVSRKVYEQISWERDIAVMQLKDLGYSLGEKIRTDGNLISRADAIDAAMEYGKKIPTYAILVKNAIEQLPSVQPELIEQGAYVRGFEQGRTQGMIDAQGEKDEQTKKGRHYYDVQRFGNNC